MPRRKQTNKNRSNLSISSSRSYVSLLYGVLSVFIIFLVILFGLKFFEIRKTGEITQEAVKTESQQGALMYTVKEGDSLWSIAESQFNNGYKWAEIAKTNNISNPGEIEEGQRLVLSSVKVNVPSQDSQPSMSHDGKIAASSYTVKSGDTLWDIAERAYGDPYKWSEIAKANNLVNPDLIYAGDTFKLPR